MSPMENSMEKPMDNSEVTFLAIVYNVAYRWKNNKWNRLQIFEDYESAMGWFRTRVVWRAQRTIFTTGHEIGSLAMVGREANDSAQILRPSP